MFDIEGQILNEIDACVEGSRKRADPPLFAKVLFGAHIVSKIPKSRASVRPACEQKIRAKYSTQINQIQEEEKAQEILLQEQTSGFLNDKKTLLIAAAVIGILIVIFMPNKKR